MENYKKGGYEKRFAIRKIVNHPDGRISTKATDPNADYFVLRLDKDPHAQKAIIAYAESVREDNRQFANDIEKKMTNEYGWEKADSDKGAEIEMELKNKFFDLIDPSKDTWVLNHSIGCIADWIVTQFASKPDKEWVSVDKVNRNIQLLQEVRSDGKCGVYLNAGLDQVIRFLEELKSTNK